MRCRHFEYTPSGDKRRCLFDEGHAKRHKYPAFAERPGAGSIPSSTGIGDRSSDQEPPPDFPLLKNRGRRSWWEPEIDLESW